MSSRLCTLQRIISVALLSAIAAMAHAQEKRQPPPEFSNKAIELIVPWGTGGGSDQMARALSRAMEKHSGLSVAVLNKPGGNGTLGLTHALAQSANGHTLALITNDFLINHASGAATIKPEDFEYIGRIVADVEMLFARSDDPRFGSFESYVKAAKANPGKITIATAGANGVEQLAMTLVNRKLGLEVKWLPFDKPGERVAAFLGGHVDLMVEEPSDMKQFIQEGKMKPLVQLTDQRTSRFPGVPTAKELGADVTLGLWRGIAIRRGTDEAIRAYLEKLVGQAVADPDFINGYIRQRSLDIRPGYLAGNEFRHSVGDEYQAISRVLKDQQK